MNNLIKKGLLTLGVAAFILPLSNPASASASELPLKKEHELLSPLPIIEEPGISPAWVYDYVETITMEYPTASAIPDEVYYEYYHDVFGWMRGLMKYESHTVVKGKYIATFKGRMYSNPL